MISASRLTETRICVNSCHKDDSLRIGALTRPESMLNAISPPTVRLPSMTCMAPTPSRMTVSSLLAVWITRLVQLAVCPDSNAEVT
ncbi:hypothetical protein D3C72_2258930 [compost metagenome]